MEQPSPDSVDTQLLLEQAQAGDAAAFDHLFARYRPYLHQVIDARLEDRLRARVDTSDIVQETQLEAYRRLGDYLKRQPMAFRLWLRKTAHERLIMARRQHLGAACRAAGREVGLPDASSLLLARQFLAADPSPSQQLGQAELCQRIREVLGQLSEGDQEILLLRNLEALSNQEAAAVLEIDPAAASQRYGRALLRLRKLLLEGGLMESQA